MVDMPEVGENGHQERSDNIERRHSRHSVRQHDQRACHSCSATRERVVSDNSKRVYEGFQRQDRLGYICNTAGWNPDGALILRSLSYPTSLKGESNNDRSTYSRAVLRRSDGDGILFPIFWPIQDFPEGSRPSLLELGVLVGHRSICRYMSFLNAFLVTYSSYTCGAQAGTTNGD